MTDTQDTTQNPSSKDGAQPDTKPTKAAKANNSTSNDSQAPTAQIKKLDIVIAGTTYAIFCPADEEAELRAAENYLNNFATHIKKEAPNLNQENLLVLSCLNLYEKINAQKTADIERQQQNKQNEHLLNKIMQEAHSIL